MGASESSRALLEAETPHFGPVLHSSDAECVREGRGNTRCDDVGVDPTRMSSAASLSQLHQAKAKQMPQTQDKTTIFLKNIPASYDCSKLLTLLEEQGFRGLFDFLHLPADFKKKQFHGFAIVNLLSTPLAQVFKDHFDGFTDWGLECEEQAAATSWGDKIHGKKNHIRRYRDSPLMHPSVPEEYKPLVFENGVLERFPPPTARLRPPQARRSTAGITEESGRRTQHSPSNCVRDGDKKTSESG